MVRSKYRTVNIENRFCITGNKELAVMSEDDLKHLLLNINPDKHTIAFYKEGEIVGYIDWSQSPIRFHGKIDDSVRIFFEALQLMTETKKEE